MTKNTLTFTILMAALTLFGGCSKDTDTGLPATQSTELEQLSPLEDFDQRKFGMFIHWGIYSVAAGEFKGQKMVFELFQAIVAADKTIITLYPLSLAKLHTISMDEVLPL